MSMYKPSELHLFLQQLGIAPKKGLSQNFLIDGNIIRKIVAAAQVKADDVVLEIGPGPGSLTQALLETGASVLAVEKDEVLASALQRFQTPTQQLEIICADIMKVPLEDTFRQRYPGKKIKVIANLPYHLTTPILAQLISLRHLFSSFTLMVQEEVARRFTASPNTKDYSSFTLFLLFYTMPLYAFFVSRHCFYPRPKVDSAVVHLEVKESPALQEEEQFFRMTRLAFEHRRKMLRSSLKPLFSSAAISAALEAIGQNPLARPESLSLDDFLRFYQAIKHFSFSVDDQTPKT